MASRTCGTPRCGHSAAATPTTAGREASIISQQRRQLVLGVDEVGDHLHTPASVAPMSRAMPTSSSRVGGERRRRLAPARAVVERARRREAERAGRDAPRRRARPISAISSGVARLAVGAALAHHVQPQRAVRHLGGDVDVVRAARRARRGTRRSSASFHESPSCSAAPGMSSTPSISSISRSWSAGCTGAKPTPQLPMTTVVTPCHDDGEHALVPRRLAVVVGVDVDEARA